MTMKMLFRLSAIASFVALMASPFALTSCSDDDDPEPEMKKEITWTDMEIQAQSGDTIYYKCIAPEGEELAMGRFIVSTAQQDDVTLLFLPDNKKVNLSLNGSSYLNLDLEPIKADEAKNNPQSLLMILKKNTQTLGSPTLATAIEISENENTPFTFFSR